MERLQNRPPGLGEARWEELLLGAPRQGLLSINEPLLPAGAPGTCSQMGQRPLFPERKVRMSA